jgi:mRNA interferase MazF
MANGGKGVSPLPKRGNVYLVRFDPTEGSEIKKTRPALIIQNDIGNRFSNITIVAAITSKFQLPVHRTNVLIKAPEGGLSVDSVVRLDQIRSVDKRRLLKRLGAAKPNTLTKVDQAIKIGLGLVALS